MSEPSRECTVLDTVHLSPADSGTQSAALQGLDVSIWCYCRAGLSRADTAMFFFFCPQPYEVLTLLRLVRA